MTREEAINEIKSWDFLKGKEIEAIHTLIPELRKEEKPLTPFQQCLSHILYKVYYASAPGGVDKFILDTVKKFTDELVELEKRQEKTDCQLRESEDERIRKTLVEYFGPQAQLDFIRGVPIQKIRDWLEKQKENPQKAISIPADCVSSAKCEDRWHKTANSLPDNGRDVLAKDALGNYLLSSFDGAQWFVSVYDGQDHPVLHTPPILEWCDIPSEKQKEQKPAWSKDDENRRDGIIQWLCEYKKEFNPKYDSLSIESIESLINWLKSIRPSWKPSEEQMEALQRAIDACESEWAYQDDELRSLLNDIKKL